MIWNFRLKKSKVNRLPALRPLSPSSLSSESSLKAVFYALKDLVHEAGNAHFLIVTVL